MMKTKLLILSILFIMPIQAQAALDNVALNKAVTLGTTGDVFFNYPSPSNNPAAASTLTDGIYQPTNVDWRDGTVYWGDAYSGEHWVEINLGGTYEISGFKAQLNENDYYTLFYKDSGGFWQTAWTIGWQLPCCMQARETTLITPILTSALKLEGFFDDGSNPFDVQPYGYSSDNLFSVAEIEAFGVPVNEYPIPEPATLGLLGLGLLGLGLSRRRKA
jgi:hypothetical protein